MGLVATREVPSVCPLMSGCSDVLSPDRGLGTRDQLAAVGTITGVGKQKFHQLNFAVGTYTVSY